MRRTNVRFILPTKVVVSAGVAALLTACAPHTATGVTSAASAGPGCVTDYVPGRDYFPDKQTVRHAKNLSISYHNSYQVITVAQPAPEAPPATYVLFRCGTPVPELTGDLAGAQTVQVPITSMFSGSTTHLPLLDELDALPVLTGVASGSAVSNPEVRARVADRSIVEYAPNQAINTELVIAARPGVLMTGGADDSAHAAIRQAGVPVVANAEWLEPTPLGRAEWIRLMGALTDRDAQAEKVFHQIEADYSRVAQRVAEVDAPRRVLLGQMYQGVWSVPGGDSYVAALITDAGGTYDWAGVRRTGSLSLSLEEVLAKARDADIWIMSADVATLEDVSRSDPRYAEFAAYRQHQVWTNNAKVSPGGGNEYWERGVSRPDLVLADLVAILHPEAADGHRLEFYRQVGR